MLRRIVSSLTVALAIGSPFTLGLPSRHDRSHGPRKFDLTVTWEQHAPNGFSRNMILINGQSPGPMIEVNEGDDVEVTVHNQTPHNTTMHFHGIEMATSPWSDGVPGVTQREILTGGTFVYKWKATQYGEYWYHAHRLGQLDDGQLGPLVIHPKKDRPNPFGLISKNRDTIRAMEKAAHDIKPLMLADWRNINSIEAWDIEIAASTELPCFDSLLINGKGKIDCWSAEKMASLLGPTQKALLAMGNFTSLTPKGCLPKSVAVLAVAAGYKTNVSAIPDELFDICSPTEGSKEVIEVKQTCDRDETWVAFEVIGAYTTMKSTFSIDGLPMWIYAVDGEYIEPQMVHAISVINGDRYSVLVKLTQAGDYTIRHAATLPIQLISGEATLSYRTKKGVPSNNTIAPYVNDAGVAVSKDVVFFNQTLQKPYPPYPVGQKADQTFILTLGNTDGVGYMWAMNGTAAPMSLDSSEPVLFKPQPNLVNNLTVTTQNNTWIDFIFKVETVPQPSHPIHKHGNKMWQIGSGQGVFKWTSVEEAMKEIPQNFNLVDPPRRDGFATLDSPRGPTWIAVRYHVTNPGAWFLHCHISTHLQGGMALVIQDGIDQFPTVPDEYLSYGA
ncbi:multicopper oxidase [Xylaria bambusicola]|uniref:multicopper oxidase n=1 Tax=Xylaria bambusicola TaxID=326684 RepID=UPI0020072D27|nr:multicopper oxidase [Xylaria bambusicola]KAI0517867.1 multicopper oxidase [Xylaria bambusicola]